MTAAHARITYRIAEVAEMTGMSLSTVQRLVRGGELRHVLVNGVRLIRPTDLERFLDERTEGLPSRRLRSTA